MKFKQPIASNRETNKWVIKDTKFKARNQEFSQLCKEKKKKTNKQKENPENRDLVVAFGLVRIFFNFEYRYDFGFLFAHSWHWRR